MGKVIELSSVRVTPLLPCPFCGDADEVELDSDDASVWVHCGGCGASGPTTLVGCREFDDMAEEVITALLDREAAEMWNERKTSTSKQEDEGEGA